MARRQGRHSALVLGAYGLLTLAVACGNDSGSDGGGDGDTGAGGARLGVGGDPLAGGTTGTGGDALGNGGTAGAGIGGQPGTGGAAGSGSGGVAGAAGAPAGTGGGSAGAPPTGVGGGSGGTPGVGGAGGSTDVAAPELLLTLYDRWEEGWLGSPAIVDLESDGSTEIVVPRADKLYAFNPDGSIKWKLEGFPGRIWASPVVADFRGDSQLEVVFASREQVIMVDAGGTTLSGFPVSWVDELRSIGAGDVDNCVLWPTGRGNLLRNGWVRSD